MSHLPSPPHSPPLSLPLQPPPSPSPASSPSSPRPSLFSGPFNPSLAGVFPGSLLEEAAHPARLLDLLQRSFACLSVLTATSLGLLAWAGIAAGWPEVLKLAACGLLVPALGGLWLVERVNEAPGTAVSRMMTLIDENLRKGQGAVAVPTHGAEPVERSMTSMIADGIRRFTRLRAATQTAGERARAVNDALREGRAKAGTLAHHLRDDGATMVQSASGIMSGAARLAEEAEVARSAVTATARDVGAAADRASSLALAVSTVTHQITQMTALAVQASEKAFGAQGAVAALDGKTGALHETADAVGRALSLAQTCVLHADESGLPPALAQVLREMASAAELAVTDMLATLAELRADAQNASARAHDLSELIHAQQRLGLALNHAVTQQGEDMTHMVTMLQRAHAGLAMLRDGVDAVTNGAVTRLADAEAMRGAASRMPAHAEAVANILRAIPDFSPNFDV